jgi:hypothetical protein
MGQVVVFDSEKESILDIKKKIYELEKKYNSNLDQLQEKIANNQELETDEVIDDLMLWRALNLVYEEKVMPQKQVAIK